MSNANPYFGRANWPWAIGVAIGCAAIVAIGVFTTPDFRRDVLFGLTHPLGTLQQRTAGGH